MTHKTYLLNLINLLLELKIITLILFLSGFMDQYRAPELLVMDVAYGK